MAAATTRPARHHVVSVLVDDMSAFEAATAAELFDSEGGTEYGVTWYRHTFCTETPGRVRVRRGPDVIVDDGLDAIDTADTLVIPGWSSVRTPPTPALADAIVRAHERGARIVTFCTGAFALAATGLLDGRRATTHWGHADEFARRFPAVDFDPAVLYVHDGRLLTAAGSASCIDLGLYLIRQDHGADVANDVARDLVVPPHRDGGQAQYIATPVPTCAAEDPLAETLDWARSHLDEPLGVEVLAHRAMMSGRTFARRFVAATGTTPHKWVVHQRVAAAQQLLESTDLSVEEVARRCGFGSAASLRAQFQQTVRSSPQAYRRTFAGTAAGRPA